MKRNKLAMRLLILLIFSLTTEAVWCQNNVPTKHQMAKVFKPDEEKTEWLICNQDSSFFKSDTLRLYSSINYFYQKSDCCKLVEWNFYKANAFTRSSLQVCTEPPIGSVLTENDYFKIKISSNKSGLYLFVVDRKDSSDSFKIIDIQEIELSNNTKSKLIVLKRMARK
jgi:hypothetical protein